MKATSLEANRKAEAFKPTHKNRIMECMDDSGKLTGNDIANRTGLTFVQVMRRCIDLIRDNKVIERGSRKGFTLYEKIY